MIIIINLIMIIIIITILEDGSHSNNIVSSLIPIFYFCKRGFFLFPLGILSKMEGRGGGRGGGGGECLFYSHAEKMLN